MELEVLDFDLSVRGRRITWQSSFKRRRVCFIFTILSQTTLNGLWNSMKVLCD